MEKNQQNSSQFFHLFNIRNEQEDYKTIRENIEAGIDFRGTNLWVLILAIIIASVGLNLNSAVFLIGAMLISPLMGPILGIGVGMGTNDGILIKRSLKNFGFSIIASVLASMVYFYLTPIEGSSSELLARTSPNIYDVVIGLFGGLAGALAFSSKKKGNVIPGAAIATSLMPPLCTAGFGLAHGEGEFFFGAIYLFFINSVFIILAAFIVSRICKFPYKEFADEAARKRAKIIISVMAIVTLIPSLYFGYDMIQQNKFQQNAEKFIKKHGDFSGNIRLNTNIDAKKRTLTLVYGGNRPISDQDIENRKNIFQEVMEVPGELSIKQGFAALQEQTKATGTNLDATQIKMGELVNQFTAIEKRLAALEEKNPHDAIKNDEITAGSGEILETNEENILINDTSAQENSEEKQKIFREIREINKKIVGISLVKTPVINESGIVERTFAILQSDLPLNDVEKNELLIWLKGRTKNDDIRLMAEIRADIKNQ